MRSVEAFSVVFNPSPAQVDASGDSRRGLSKLRELAPDPRVRVGIATSVQTVRLTSARRFQIIAGEQRIETQDALVGLEYRENPRSVSYSIELGNYLTLLDAEQFVVNAEEALDEELFISREPESGRYSIRLGDFESLDETRSRSDELRALGFYPVQKLSGIQLSLPAERIVVRTFGKLAGPLSSANLVVVPEQEPFWVEVDGKPYRGFIEVKLNSSGQLTVVNVVNLDDYLKGVVPAELSPSVFPEKEAIKAQALAARTYVLKRYGEFEENGYDICATPACQVYGGIGVEHRMASDAVDETANEVLTYDGNLIEALYTSTCGGRTENSENVFSFAHPYLVSQACFLRSKTNSIHANNVGSVPIEWAILASLGIVEKADFPVATLYDGSVSLTSARKLMSRALVYLGQDTCHKSGTPVSNSSVDIVQLAELLGKAMCWERGLSFLLSREDVLRMVPKEVMPETSRIFLAHAMQEGMIRIGPNGIEPGKPLSPYEVVQTLYRVVNGRGGVILRNGQLRDIEPSGRLHISEGTLKGDKKRLSMRLSPETYFYQRAGVENHYVPELSLLAGDRVEFLTTGQGIDILVLVSQMTSFDRSSRMSRWVVRKSNEDLSREVNSRYGIGVITNLLPIRYGRSGRITRLQVVGNQGLVELNGLEVRRALGIRENLFFLNKQYHADGSVGAWVFTGRGWGHGVGLCQVGAYGMAAAGYDYRQILQQYYPGSEIEYFGFEN